MFIKSIWSRFVRSIFWEIETSCYTQFVLQISKFSGSFDRAKSTGLTSKWKSFLLAAQYHLFPAANCQIVNINMNNNVEHVINSMFAQHFVGGYPAYTGTLENVRCRGSIILFMSSLCLWIWHWNSSMVLSWTCQVRRGGQSEWNRPWWSGYICYLRQIQANWICLNLSVWSSQFIYTIESTGFEETSQMCLVDRLF